MIITARQLEEMHRDGGRNGRVALRAGTRLTPLAREWIRKTKVTIHYLDGAPEEQRTASPRLKTVIWWSETEQAVAKAALMSVGTIDLHPLKAHDATSAVRSVADQLRSRRADAGVLMVTSAGASTVQANRTAEVRAIVGTTHESVDAAMRSISANVLILEQSDRSFEQVRNVIARFLAGGEA